jgi:hypothetical protein
MTDLLMEPLSNVCSTGLVGMANRLLEWDSTSLLLTRERERGAESAWFWTEAWQDGERRVDQFVARGETRLFDDAASFLAFLDAPDM